MNPIVGLLKLIITLAIVQGFQWQRKYRLHWLSTLLDLLPR